MPSYLENEIKKNQLQNSICKFCKHPFVVKGGVYYIMNLEDPSKSHGGHQIYCPFRQDGCLGKYKVITECPNYEYDTGGDISE